MGQPWAAAAAGAHAGARAAAPVRLATVPAPSGAALSARTSMKAWSSGLARTALTGSFGPPVRFSAPPPVIATARPAIRTSPPPSAAEEAAAPILRATSRFEVQLLPALVCCRGALSRSHPTVYGPVFGCFQEAHSTRGFLHVSPAVRVTTGLCHSAVCGRMFSVWREVAVRAASRAGTGARITPGSTPAPSMSISACWRGRRIVRRQFVGCCARGGSRGRAQWGLGPKRPHPTGGRGC